MFFFCENVVNKDLRDFSSIRKIRINFKFYSVSQDTLKERARLRLSGVNLDANGILYRVPSSFIHEDKIIIPDCIKAFSCSIDQESEIVKNVKYIQIPADFDLEHWASCYGLYIYMYMKVNLASACTLVVNGDFNLPIRIFKYLKCNILVKGVLRTGDFKAYMTTVEKKAKGTSKQSARFMARFRASYNSSYVLEDNTTKHIIDYDNFVYHKIQK